MRVRQVDANRRSGVSATEFAFVAVPLFMFFFGVMEYGRFFLDRNLLNNAAREACRYALANNTNSNIWDPTGTNPASVQYYVKSYMGGRTGDFSSYTVGLSGVSARTGAVYSNAGVNNLVSGDSISVSITATYAPMLPMVLASTIQTNGTCTMLVEGAM